MRESPVVETRADTVAAETTRELAESPLHVGRRRRTSRIDF
jgi:hypothetical protein